MGGAHTRWSAGVLAATVAWLGTGMAEAQTPVARITSLHSFAPHDGGDSINADGAAPGEALVKGPDGAFYGSTRTGGAGGAGTLFRVTGQGQFSTLHEFAAIGDAFDNADGIRPHALVMGDDGNFYGTTLLGGTHGGGTIFRLTPAGVLTTLHEFGFGDAPMALTSGADGAFYGVTFRGGANDTGSIFSFTVAGGLVPLHSFAPVVCGTPSGCSNLDGALPEAPLLLASDGNFYGSTSLGGEHGTGVLFKVTPLGVVTVLHAFDAITTDPNGGTTYNVDGYNPGSALAEGEAGSFFGTTYRGGPDGGGTAFRVTSDGTFEVLHAFGGPGGNPVAGLMRASDGNFYGIGTSEFEHALFRLTPTGEFTPLFVAGVDFERAPTFATATLVQDADGTFYGSARGGGEEGGGMLFSFTLDSAPAVWLQSSVPYTSPPTGPGDLFVLYWEAANVTECLASGGGDGDGWSGSVLDTSGSVVLSERSSGAYSFTIECTGSEGAAAQTISVQIGEPDGDAGALGAGTLVVASLLALRRRRAARN
jgi:uncharacterized repeat protein (TIGR03803 family)